MCGVKFIEALHAKTWVARREDLGWKPKRWKIVGLFFPYENDFRNDEISSLISYIGSEKFRHQVIFRDKIFHHQKIL